MGLTATDWAALIGVLVVVYKAIKVDTPTVVAQYETALSAAVKRAEAAAKRAEDAEKRTSEVLTENQKYINTLREWQQGIEILIKQLADKDIIPAWQPDPGDFPD